MSIKDFFSFRKRYNEVEEVIKEEVIKESIPPEVIEEQNFDYTVTFDNFCIIEREGFAQLKMNINFLNNKQNIPNTLYMGMCYVHRNDTLLIRFFSKDNDNEGMYRILSDENAFVEKKLTHSYSFFSDIENINEWQVTKSVASVYTLRNQLKGVVLKGNYNQELLYNLKDRQIIIQD